MVGVVAFKVVEENGEIPVRVIQDVALGVGGPSVLPRAVVVVPDLKISVRVFPVAYITCCLVFKLFLVLSC